MVSVSHNYRTASRRGVTLCLTTIITGMAIVAFAQPAEERARQARIDSFIQIAREQVNRGYYQHAEIELDKAATAEFAPFVTESQKREIAALLQTIHTAANTAAEQRQAIEQALRQSDALAAQGNYAQAASLLRQIERSPYLAEHEKQIVAASLIEYDDKSKTQAVQLAVEDLMPQNTATAQTIVVQEPVAPATYDQTPPATDLRSETDAEDSYLQVIRRERAVRIDYTTAIVNDAMSRSRALLQENRFEEARQVLRNAMSTVERNKLLLGDALYAEYMAQLNNEEQTLNEQQHVWQAQQDQRRVEEAATITDTIRDTIEEQRKQAIEDYMDRAYAFQAEERYEEALGQLELLLGVDPLHQRALMMKQSLEHWTRYREQRRIQDEIEREELDVLMEATSKQIPYAEEITYFRNWKEIAARREQNLLETMSPEDILVNRQLDERVDLSMLTEYTTLAEAIDLVRQSVSPPLAIVVQWGDLSMNAFVERDTPVNMSGEGLVSVVLRTALNRILQAVSSAAMADLGFVLEDGVITIATVESLPTSFRNEVYDVADLLNPPANGGGGMYGGGGGVGNWQSQYRGSQLIWVIQQTINPESWYEEGGEGRINQYSENKLLVWQTPEVHKQIREFLEMLRIGLGEQVAVEARFLVVGENFLQDIGLDLHTINLRVGGPFNKGGTGEPGVLGIAQSTRDHVIPTGTNVPGSLAGTLTQPGLSLTSNITFDDLVVDFIIQATQAHRNSRTLNAPKAVVMNGETASLSVDTETRIVSNSSLVTESVGTGDVPLLTTYWDRELESLNTGIQMSITPTITADKKYVLLLINANLTDLLAVSTQQVTALGPNNELLTDQFALPTTQNSSINTRVNVPDRGTVMLGGLTLAAENERDSGIPILSKIPILNLLFSNHSVVRDKHILLILVKPTIMLQEENEQDAIAAMEKRK